MVDQICFDFNCISFVFDLVTCNQIRWIFHPFRCRVVRFSNMVTVILVTVPDLVTIWLRKCEIWLRYGYGTSVLVTIWLRGDLVTIWLQYGYDMVTDRC